MLLVIEGYTDIRFVSGVSEICRLHMVVPAGPYAESGLKQRIAESGIAIEVDEIPGGRLAFQAACFRYLMARAKDFDVILSPEMLRASLNSCLAGTLQGVPVITYLNTPAVEYFQCRRERGQIGALKSLAGETVIRVLSWISGKLATRCVAVGPYLVQVASRYSKRVSMGHAYGVDTGLYHPIAPVEKAALRERLDLPSDAFVIFFASRISHEKDPETVLHAAALARQKGLNAIIMNLGGGYKDFLQLARDLSLPDVDQWVIGRPAAHPMRDLPKYYQAADVLVQASLDEGAGMSPLEAMACGTPAACTAVGGMAQILPGYARLTPRRDAAAMAEQLLWIAAHPAEARAQALEGREFVIREWSRAVATAELSQVFADVGKNPEAGPATAVAPQSKGARL